MSTCNRLNLQTLGSQPVQSLLSLSLSQHCTENLGPPIFELKCRSCDMKTCKLIEGRVSHSRLIAMHGCQLSVLNSYRWNWLQMWVQASKKLMHRTVLALWFLPMYGLKHAEDNPIKLLLFLWILACVGWKSVSCLQTPDLLCGHNGSVSSTVTPAYKTPNIFFKLHHPEHWMYSTFLKSTVQ